jgi:hypothetical protein
MTNAFSAWLRRGGFFAQLLVMLLVVFALAGLALGGTKAIVAGSVHHNAAEGDIRGIRASYHDARAALNAVDAGDAGKMAPLDAAKKDLARAALRLNDASYEGAAHLARSAAGFALAFDAYETCASASRKSSDCSAGAQQEATGQGELHAGVMQAYLGDDTL